MLENFPEKREVLHAHLDEAENISFAGAAATELTESFIILAGGGLKKENIEEGIKITITFQSEADARAFRAARQVRDARAEEVERSKLYRCSKWARPAAEAGNQVLERRE